MERFARIGEIPNRKGEDNQMINPSMILQIKQAWDAFTGNHPKFPLFLKAVSQKAIKEGSIIEIAITTPEGKTMNTNLRVKQEDMLLFQSIRDMVD